MNASSLQSGSLKVATVMGIPVRVHFSWLIVFGLITWSLSTYYFPKVAPELPGSSYWMGGAIAALMLFLSVALHELSHSYIAVRYGLNIVSITLFIFGGVAQMKSEPPHPKAEFRMAIAGPLSSFMLSFLFFVIHGLVQEQVTKAIFQYLYQVNLILGIFNLIPGFPMDGGRVIRAFIWNKTGDFFYATKKAAGYGQKIAIFFIVFGIFSIFSGFGGGLWLMLIGWFLHSAAQASHQQAGLQELLKDIKVKDIMIRDIVTVSPGMKIEAAVNDFFLKFGYGGFPVTDDGKFLGILSLKEIRNVSKERWRDAPVSEVYIPHDKRWEVSGDDNAWKVLELMVGEDKGRFPVIEKGNMVGLITRNGIAKYVQMSAELR